MEQVPGEYVVLSNAALDRWVLRFTSKKRSATRRRQQIGVSRGGRPIWAVLVGTGPKAIVLVAQQHGEETFAHVKVMRTLTRLARDPDTTVGALLREYTIVGVPRANPEGHQLRQRHTDDPEVTDADEAQSRGEIPSTGNYDLDEPPWHKAGRGFDANRDAEGRSDVAQAINRLFAGLIAGGYEVQFVGDVHEEFPRHLVADARRLVGASIMDQRGHGPGEQGARFVALLIDQWLGQPGGAVFRRYPNTPHPGTLVNRAQALGFDATAIEYDGPSPGMVWANDGDDLGDAVIAFMRGDRAGQYAENLAAYERLYPPDAVAAHGTQSMGSRRPHRDAAWASKRRV